MGKMKAGGGHTQEGGNTLERRSHTGGKPHAGGRSYTGEEHAPGTSWTYDHQQLHSVPNCPVLYKPPALLIHFPEINLLHELMITPHLLYGTANSDTPSVHLRDD